MRDEGEPSLLFLVDNEWRATEEYPDPPLTAVVGAWPVTATGWRGRFQPNPLYLPSTPGAPVDPVDAVLGRLAAGEFDPDDLPDVLRDVVFGIALDDRGHAVVRPAPDGVPSVVLTTGYAHRDRVAAADWRLVTVDQVAAALPGDGIDVWLNPGARNSLRVLASAVRAAAQPSPDQPSAVAALELVT